MRPTSRADQAHTEAYDGLGELAMGQSEQKNFRWSLILGTLVAFAAVGTLWLLFDRSGTVADMAVVFQGRRFDKSTRRMAVTHLTQLGIPVKVDAQGELLVKPDRLTEAQASLEKAGLKPVSLEELREPSAGALSILESPAQREDRRRQAKERELAWLLKRLDDLAEAHVTIEPAQGGSRWIGTKQAQRQRVRVFVEGGEPGRELSDEAVDRIEKTVIASLPATGPGLVTIHDAKKIYRMAGQGTATDSQDSGVSNFQDRETALASKVREGIPGLAGASVRVALRQVDETPKEAATAQTLKPEETTTRLYFNQPAAVAVTPDSTASRTRTVRTERARVQILPEGTVAGQFASSESKRVVRDRLSAILAPVLIEQIDWLSPPQRTETPETAGSAAIAAAPSTTEPKTASLALAGSKPTLTPLTESTRLRLGPWIMAGVVSALVVGGLVLWRSMKSDGGYLSGSNYDHGDSSQWVRNLAAAVSEPESHRGPHDLTTDKAAHVLSSWIAEKAEPDPPETQI